MMDDPRIETVARALARHRLGHSLLANSLPSEVARSILDKSVEKLWPSLRDEAEIVVEALNQGDGQSPASKTATTEPVSEPALPQQPPAAAEKKPPPRRLGAFDGL
jgi:hypothetical protein